MYRQKSVADRPKVWQMGKFVLLRVEGVSLIDKLYPPSHLQLNFLVYKTLFFTLRNTFDLSATLFGYESHLWDSFLYAAAERTCGTWNLRRPDAGGHFQIG